ncbi:MAG: hypothetical protein AAF492_03295 [Verrucomicrobiota bacterium]
MARRNRHEEPQVVSPRSPWPIKLLKFVVGLLLLPVSFAVSKTVFDLLRSLNIDAVGRLSMSTWWFIGGFVLWVILFFVLPRPMRTYVLAHELSHALWAWLCGVKVSGIKVSKDGGHVRMNRTNFLILLAPYFFPFYTILVILLYLILSAFWDMKTYEPFWMGLLGLTWAFHITFTISSLQVIQTDITSNGYLFSYTLIYILNLLGFALWLVAITDPTYRDLGRMLKADSLMVYSWCWEQGAAMFQYLKNIAPPS